MQQYTQEQIDAAKHRLDEWAGVSLAPTSVPFELAPKGCVFRGMNNVDDAKNYADQVAAFFTQHGLNCPVFVVSGPTTTTRCKFEVVEATAGYSVVYRSAPAERQESAPERPRGVC